MEELSISGLINFVEQPGGSVSIKSNADAQEWLDSMASALHKKYGWSTLLFACCTTNAQNYLLYSSGKNPEEAADWYENYHRHGNDL